MTTRQITGLLQINERGYPNLSDKLGKSKNLNNLPKTESSRRDDSSIC
jgi:hypothetical protein